MSLSSAVAAELSRRVLSDDDDDANDEEARSRRLRTALSDLAEATLGEEIAARASSSEVESISGGGDGMESASKDDVAKALADDIASSAPAYQMLRDAVRQTAAAAPTSSGAATAGNKRAKHDVDTDGSGCDYKRGDAMTDEVWGLNDDDDDDDTTGATNTNANTGTAAKSFSLFDMLDSQHQGIGMGIGIGAQQRVSAQEILTTFAGTGGSADAQDTNMMGDDDPADAAAARYNDAASLLERVDDLEDLLFDPFGNCTAITGDVWPQINRVLRSGLGLGGDDASTVPPPSPDVIGRFARVHSQLDRLCASSSLGGGDFGPQRIDLLVNVTDALVAMHRRLKESWCCIDGSGEARMSEDVVSLAQIMLDMLIDSVPALELAQEEECHRLLLGILKMAAEPTPECGGISLANVISGADPYAEWFSFLSRFIHPATLVKAFTETRVLENIVQFCNKGPGRIAPTNLATMTSSSGYNMIAVGTDADLGHCLYLHSLSILRTLLVVTAGNERTFPYQELGIESSNAPLSQSVTRIVAPFVKVLSVGAKEGPAVVDASLASLCEEAVGTVLRGIKPNTEVFEAVFDTNIVPVADKMITATDGNPSVAAIMRLKLMAC